MKSPVYIAALHKWSLLRRRKAGSIRRCFVASDRVRVIHRDAGPQSAGPSVTIFLNDPIVTFAVFSIMSSGQHQVAKSAKIAKAAKAAKTLCAVTYVDLRLNPQPVTRNL